MSIYNYPYNINSAHKLTIYSLYLDLRSSLAFDFYSRRIPNEKYKSCAESAKNYLSYLISEDFNINHDSIHQLYIEIIKTLDVGIFEPLALCLEYHTNFQDTSKARRVKRLANEIIKKNPDTFTPYFNMFLVNKQITESFMEALHSIHDDIVNDNSRTIRVISPFYAVGFAHIWPLLALNIELLNDDAIKMDKGIEIWANPEWSLNAPLESLLDNHIRHNYVIPKDVLEIGEHKLLEYYIGKNLYDVRLEVPNRYNRGLPNISNINMLKESIKLSLEMHSSHEDYSNHVLIHYRSSDFKPDGCMQQSIRNSKPETYYMMASSILSNGDIPLFINSNIKPQEVSPETQYLKVKDKETYLEQIKALNTCKMLIGCQSGLSYLWMVGVENLLLINMCSLSPEKPLPSNHLICTKKIVPKPTTKNLSIEECIGLLIKDWVSEEFLYYFNLKDLSSEEINFAYKEFLNKAAKDRYTLKKLIAEQKLPTTGKMLQDRYLSQTTYQTISSVIAYLKGNN